VAGRLTSVDGSTLTIQGRQGSRKVTLGASTRIRRYATGSRSDLKAGDTVIVSGTGANRTVTVLPATSGQ
jgi:multidrug efflux pump subunit AcrA (membrane-fusion protein)